MDHTTRRAELQALITAKLKEAIRGYTKLPNTPLVREALLKSVLNLLANDELVPMPELVVLTHAVAPSSIFITERARWNEDREELTKEGWREP